MKFNALDLVGVPFGLALDLPSDPEQLAKRTHFKMLACWQLVRVYCARNGVYLPESMDPCEAPPAPFVPVLGDPRPCDILAFALSGNLIDHVGVVVPGRFVLQTTAELKSSQLFNLDLLLSAKTRSLRGIYRLADASNLQTAGKTE